VTSLEAILSRLNRDASISDCDVLTVTYFVDDLFSSEAFKCESVNPLIGRSESSRFGSIDEIPEEKAGYYSDDSSMHLGKGCYTKTSLLCN
jgi:hypothetical protein